MRDTLTKKKLRKNRKRALILFLPILLILLTLFSGYFITFDQSPQLSDAIIILSGGGGRVEEGATLYNEGYASSIILSNARESISHSGNMLQTALALGIPASIIFTENEALSTYQNALYTLPIMQEYGFKSAIVVSSDFHMRRVKFIFEHVYKDSRIELSYVGSDSGYNAQWWWSDRYSRETTFNEYVKMIGNTLGYNGPEAKSILDQIKNWFR